MNLNELSLEQQERIRSCTTPEELEGFLEREGIELSDETLDELAGGVKIVSTKSKKILKPLLDLFS